QTKIFVLEWGYGWFRLFDEVHFPNHCACYFRVVTASATNSPISMVWTSTRQLALSFLVKGNPLYNEQVLNVYFGMFGNQNWGLNAYSSRSPDITLTSLVAKHPAIFLRNWYHNLLNVPRLDLVQYPLMLFSFAGILFSLKHRAVYSIIFLLFLVFVAFTAS